LNLPDKLFTDLADIIESRKQVMYRQANSGAVLMFWEVGTRINVELLRNERAEYGKRIVATLSSLLVENYGKTFDITNLRRMMRFAERFKDPEIVATLSPQLGGPTLWNFCH